MVCDFDPFADEVGADDIEWSGNVDGSSKDDTGVGDNDGGDWWSWAGIWSGTATNDDGSLEDGTRAEEEIAGENMTADDGGSASTGEAWNTPSL